MNQYIICHHGILGQKWGVRRYQNTDGTLTEAGKKRYYTYDSDWKEYTITEEGKKYNRDHSSGKERAAYKESVKKQIAANDKTFEDNKKIYYDTEKANKKHYASEREKWLADEGKYKGKDYEAFKDISADDWYKSEAGKAQVKAYNALRESVENAAKKNPLYDKSYSQLKDQVFDYMNSGTVATKQISYGQEVVNSIMMDLYTEAYSQK